MYAEMHSPVTLIAAEDITAGQRIKLNGTGGAAVAGLGEAFQFIAENNASSGGRVACRDRKAPGMFLCKVSGTPAINTALYGAAAGALAAAVSGSQQAIVAELASATGGLVLCYLV